MSISVSAPGKVHLIGEHAVVYGVPAIIAAIENRCRVTAEEHDKIKIESDFGVNFEDDIKNVLSFADEVNALWKECNKKKNFSELFSVMRIEKTNPMKAAVGTVMRHLNLANGISLKIDSKIPAGAGLGSSSAMSVSIPFAVAELNNIEITKEEINKIAFSLEQFNHGTPSGGDNSACCYGGLIWFQKSQPKNIIRYMKKEIPYELENFLMVYTGKPKKTTGELVQQVRNLNEDFRNEKMENIKKAVYEMRDALEKKQKEKISDLMNTAQNNLTELGVSTPKINRLCEAVRNISGGAKLCGAGGGGIVLCYHEDKQLLKDIIKSEKFECWETELGAEGVREEK